MSYFFLIVRLLRFTLNSLQSRQSFDTQTYDIFLNCEHAYSYVTFGICFHDLIIWNVFSSYNVILGLGQYSEPNSKDSRADSLHARFK